MAAESSQTESMAIESTVSVSTEIAAIAEATPTTSRSLAVGEGKMGKVSVFLNR